VPVKKSIFLVKKLLNEAKYPAAIMYSTKVIQKRLLINFGTLINFIKYTLQNVIHFIKYVK